MVKRVGNRARRGFREASIYGGGYRRNVGYRHSAFLARPLRRQTGKLHSVDQRHHSAFRVEVMDAGNCRVRVRERDPSAQTPKRGKLAYQELFRLYRNVESVRLVPPKRLYYTPFDCLEENVCLRTAAQRRLCDKRHDGIADDKPPRPRAGDHDLQNSRLHRRGRICEHAVRRAGVEHVFKDGVRRAFGIGERVDVAYLDRYAVAVGVAYGVRIQRIGVVDEEFLIVRKSVKVSVRIARIGVVEE